MKKLLITGATGFVGSRAAAYYQNKYEVYTPTHEEMDITDPVSVRQFFEQIKPDYVIHCAAISDVGTCQRNPLLAEKVNVQASVHIAGIAYELGAKCLLSSSDQVYVGSDVKEPHKESEEVIPGNVYGRGKLRAEEECLKCNPDSVSLRLSWMYDSRTLTEKHSDFLRTFVPAYQNGDKMIYSDMDHRGITDVMEVVKNLEPAFKLPGGVYNFGSPCEDSFYATMEKVFERLELDKTRLCKAEGASYRNLTMDQSKLNKYGISFPSTTEGLIRNIRSALQKFTG